MRFCIVFFTLLVGASSGFGKEKITDECTFAAGPVNGVLIERDGRRLAVYGWAEDAKNIDHVLLPHGRRDLVWKARRLVDAGAGAIAPAQERSGLETPNAFWDAFTKTRFHDYAQQTTKILAAPLAVERWIQEGDKISWRGVTLEVLETPGFTRGSVSYLTRLSGKQIAFTGDLLYGDGKILDLYSFQDAIPAAQVRGYHGYGSRLAELIVSLRKVAAVQPDIIVPARGPVIWHPQEAIERLVKRVQALYANYLSTNALHWYFKEPRMRICGERVLGAGAEIKLMPYAHHEQTPDWVFEHSTSRLLVSDNGHGFLLDCGYQRVIDAVNELISKDVIKQVDGIFVTHYHDDHTDMVQAAAAAFECPVYATKEYADVLERPEAYHLPAMTANPIKDVQVVEDGKQMKWHEFDLTFHFFPGQTLYHGALLAEKPSERPIFFVGDAFAPSGLDDYCLLNRNLVHQDAGYLLCLQKVQTVGAGAWLVNEHIRYVFEFNDEELTYLDNRYRARIDILRELFPWDDPNYGIDEQWAVFYPYGARLTKGEETELAIRITNHSPVTRTFFVKPHTRSGLTLIDHQSSLTLPARQAGALRLRVRADGGVGNYLVTADVRTEGMEFREWVEALVTVE